MADKKSPDTSKPAGGKPPEKGKPATASDKDAIPAEEEFGGRGGADPTRFGDWEKDGRCVDF